MPGLPGVAGEWGNPAGRSSGLPSATPVQWSRRPDVYGVGAYAHDAVGIIAICRRSFALTGSKNILMCDLLMLLIACKRRASVIRACQCPSASQDGSSNPEATSDLQSGSDCLIVNYDTNKVQT